MDYRSVWEQIVSGIFGALWLILVMPFVWIWHFIVLVLIETRNVSVKIVGWVIATGLVGFVFKHFFHYPLQ